MMNEYTCDNWVVLFMNGPDKHYRLLTGISGGYLYGDSWRMNSGIVRVSEDENGYLLFYGHSGSCYRSSRESYGLRMNNAGIYEQLRETCPGQIELLDENTDWLKQDWIINVDK